MKCVHCGATVIQGAKFCATCGKPAAFGCPHCGAALAPGAKFCQDCGRSVEAAAPASVGGWWGPPKGATPLDMAFRAGIILVSIGTIIDFYFLLRLGALAAGGYLLIQGDTRRGVALVAGVIVSIPVSIILAFLLSMGR